MSEVLFVIKDMWPSL